MYYMSGNTNKSETLKRLVWREMIQAKSWEQYVSDYIGDRIVRRKWFNSITIALAVIGGSTWKFLESKDLEWVTPILFGLVGITQILTAIQKHVVIDTEAMESLHKLRGMYISYFNKLERLYITICPNTTSFDEIESVFYQLREDTLLIESVKDSANIKVKKRILKRVEKRVLEGYLNVVYYAKDNPIHL